MLPSDPILPDKLCKPDTLLAPAIVVVADVDVGFTMDPVTGIWDLPHEVLSLILSSLDDIRDAVACCATSPQLLACMKHARCTLSITASALCTGLRSQQNKEHLAGVIHTLGKFLPGTIKLSLSNLSLDDALVSALVARLPQLEVLDLTGCRKLTPAVITSLTLPASAAANSQPYHPLLQPPDGSYPRHSMHNDALGHPWIQYSGHEQSAKDLAGQSCDRFHVASTKPRPSRLRVLGMQRCFQMNSRSLAQILSATSSGTVPLAALTMSHVDLSSLPLEDFEDSSENEPASLPCGGLNLQLSKSALLATAGSMLKVLALNNCINLCPPVMHSLASCCPRLQMLFLGGSSLCSKRPRPDRDATLSPRLQSMLGLLRAELANDMGQPEEALEASIQLLAMAISLPELTVLELTFLDKSLLTLLPALIQQLTSSALLPAALTESLTGRACPLKALQVLDLTKQNHVSAMHTHLHQHHLVPLADLPPASSASPLGATSAPHAAAADPSAATASLAVPSAASSAPPSMELALVLRAAVSCSNYWKWTPLHFAADANDPGTAGALLALGAPPDAKSTHGTTALFLAAEAGHCAVVDVLLASGASPVVANGAGEAPLYIAALRGHMKVVQSLLECLSMRHIEWHSPLLYGDGWTPLMAAAVADRHDVAALLLTHAGNAAPGLTAAQNRYGQSVMHIAARRGSLGLLRLLFCHGGRRAMSTLDGKGDTPVDVAMKNRHSTAVAELRRLASSGCSSVFQGS